MSEPINLRGGLSRHGFCQTNSNLSFANRVAFVTSFKRFYRAGICVPAGVHSSLRGRCARLTWDRHKLGPEQGRRINLKGNVLSANFLGSNNLLDDDAARPASCRTHSPSQILFQICSIILSLLQISGRRHAGRNGATR